jgi:phosphohistidine swiveling domain-containing protein
LNQILDDPNLGIIIQEMVHGEYSAVVFSRNVNTGKKGLAGTLVKGQCEDIVSGKTSGESIEALRNINPALYDEISRALELLEKETGYPQEVELTISGGKAYFLQTRNMRLDPLAEAAVMKELSSAAATIPSAFDFHTRLGSRTIYGLKEGALTEEPAFKSASYIGGTITGIAAYSTEKARQLARSGQGVILIVTPETSDYVSTMLSIDKIGIITLFGNSSSHSSVVARGAGIPAVINPEEVDVRGLVREGDEIGIYNGGVYISPAAVEQMKREMTAMRAVDLLPYGIDVKALRADIRARWKAASYDELRGLNTDKYIEFKDNQAAGRDEAAYRSNLEKHFLHELFLEKGTELGKSISALELELSRTIAGRTQKDGGSVEDKGGIDLRSLPALARANGAGRPGRLSTGKMDLKAEKERITKMVRADILPADERIQEYVFACSAKGVMAVEKKEMVDVIAEFLRLQEDRAESTTSELKQMLKGLI